MKKEANKRKIDQVQSLILQHKAEKQGKPRKTKRNNDSKNSKLPKKSERTLSLGRKMNPFFSRKVS